MKHNVFSKLFSGILVVALLFSFFPPMQLHAHAAENPYAGKTISILGDSISTMVGVSNNTSANSTIGKNAVYYKEGHYGITRKDAWWHQTADALGLELLVNNSWSGSAVLKPRVGAGSEAYLTRCVQLHNDRTGQEPDIIAVFMGTNDFTFYGSTLGSAEIDYSRLIQDNGNGTFTYGVPTTSCEAYAIMLHKMRQRYPRAEIYCMNLFSRRDPQIANHNPVSGQPTAFNDELEKIISRFGCILVDLERLVPTDAATFDRYLSDNVHPNAAGMDLMTEALVEAMMGRDVQMHQIVANLTGVTASIPGLTMNGDAMNVSLQPKDPTSELTVTVTMGGKDITVQVFKNGAISIPAVTGDVTITAKGAFSMGGHLQQLPGNVCCGTNLWTALQPEHLFYTGTEWGLVNSVPNAHSITFPVNPGDRIWASSLGKAGENGYGANGVRITWYGSDGVISSKTIYAEDKTVTAPAGAVAVNVPMYTGESKWEVNLLNREHRYDNGLCTVCGVSVLGSDWIAPNFAQGDYTMVVIPDTQILVQSWPQVYYDQMQWIADNKDALNIQAVMHMGDIVNNNTDTEWTVCKTGTDILEAAGIPWMPMRGNHDDSAWFNRYYDYKTYGTDQSWFGGSYEEGKLDHSYWFVSVGDREYLILSLGYAPSQDVLTWANGIVEENSEKNVILNSHAYINKDGTLLNPYGTDVWDAFKNYGNVVLAMGGHVHCPDIVTYVAQNGAGNDVTSLLVDRQNDDVAHRYAMVALLTFHKDSNTVDVNWYSTRYDALYKPQNQFSISVPHIHEHSYTATTVPPTCIAAGGTLYTCTVCSDSYL